MKKTAVKSVKTNLSGNRKICLRQVFILKDIIICYSLCRDHEIFTFKTVYSFLDRFNFNSFCYIWILSERRKIKNIFTKASFQVFSQDFEFYNLLTKFAIFPWSYDKVRGGGEGNCDHLTKVEEIRNQFLQMFYDLKKKSFYCNCLIIFSFFSLVFDWNLQLEENKSNSSNW